MGRFTNNNSYDSSHWSNAKLIREIGEYANMTRYSAGIGAKPRDGESPTAFIKRQTQLYRNSWLNPLIDELRRRLDKKAQDFTVPVRSIGAEYVGKIEVVAETLHEARVMTQARFEDVEVLDDEGNVLAF